MMLKSLFIIILFLLPTMISADDGSRLWLRADNTAKATVTANVGGATVDIALDELRTQWKGPPVKLRLRRFFGFLFKTNDSYRIRGNSRRGYVLSARSEIGLLYASYHLLRL